MSFRRKILRYWEKRGKKEVQKLQKRIAKSRQANLKAQDEFEKMEVALVKAKGEINKREAGTLVGKEPTTFTPTLSPLLRRERYKSQVAAVLMQSMAAWAGRMMIRQGTTGGDESLAQITGTAPIPYDQPTPVGPKPRAIYGSASQGEVELPK